MPFASFSSQLVIENTTAVHNAFIEEHLPAMNGDVLRVYLYGLHIAGMVTRPDNTLESIAAILRLTTDEVVDCYKWLQDQGLVEVLNFNPIMVQYLPVKSGARSLAKYNKDEFRDFNTHMEAVIKGRMITPGEFTEYYEFIRRHHIEPMALVMCAQHCVSVKEDKASYKYILTVARQWVYEGIRTVKAVEEKLATELAMQKILKSKKAPTKNMTLHSFNDADLEGVVKKIEEVRF